MSAAVIEAFRRYAREAFVVVPKGDEEAILFSNQNADRYAAYLEELKKETDVEVLARLLGEKIKGPRDLGIDLWLPVLCRIREILGEDRDARMAEVIVQLVYGELEEARGSWLEARRAFPADAELSRLGIVTAAFCRDPEILEDCADLLPTQERDRVLDLAKKERWEEIIRMFPIGLGENRWFRKAREAVLSRGG